MPISFGFISQYRKRVLYGKLKADVWDMISALCRYKDVDIIDGAVCKVYIRLSIAYHQNIVSQNL